MSLTLEIEAFIEGRVASGRYRSASEVVRAAFWLLDEEERRHRGSERPGPLLHPAGPRAGAVTAGAPSTAVAPGPGAADRETGALVRAKDWSATPLGPADRWPQSLRTVVDLVLASPLAMVVLWGPQLIQVYNDAYAAIAAARHPAALGQPTRECWPEVWPFNAPIYEAVFRGEARAFEAQQLTVLRRGVPEEAWFDLTYSPLRDEAGSVAGVLVTRPRSRRRSGRRPSGRQPRRRCARVKSVSARSPTACRTSSGSPRPTAGCIT